MEAAAVAFRQRRLDVRREELASATVFAAEPILQLLQELERDGQVLDRMMLTGDRDQLEAFRTRLIEACERAKELELWAPPSRAAELAEVSTETVRRWCRTDRIRYRETPTGYLVNVQEALEMVGKA